MSRRQPRSFELSGWISAALAMLLPATAFSADDPCKLAYPKRLVIDKNLAKESLVLRRDGVVRPMSLPGNGTFPIYSATYTIAGQGAERLSLFHSKVKGTCRIAKDEKRSTPLRIPVFFLGRLGQRSDAVEQWAKKFVFLPTAPLEERQDFSDVTFQVGRGGWGVRSIEPFFSCGQPGILVCTDDCANTKADLSKELVKLVVRGQSGLEKNPENEAAKPKNEASGVQGSDSLSKPGEIKRLILKFEKPDGSRLSPVTVLQAEGKARLEGYDFRAAADGLEVDLPVEVYRRAVSNDALLQSWTKHRVLSVKPEEGQIRLIVEPLYVRASDIILEIPAAKNAICGVTLDVPYTQRIGMGWAKFTDVAPVRLRVSEAGRIELPEGTDENELLIDTSPGGEPISLSTSGSACRLDAPSIVSVEELRSLHIRRSLQETNSASL